MFSEIVVNFNIDAVAITCRIDGRQLSFCSVYFKPQLNSIRDDLESLLRSLPSPLVLGGDMNAHNEIWGCSSTQKKGREVESFILDSGLSLMNNGDPTYIHPGYGSISAIDLTFCSPSLNILLEWGTVKEAYGSDHTPIVISSLGPTFMNSRRINHGHRGRACLLRAICEEAENPINEHNGVLGDVIHIILTPSTSIREDLHPEYYKAEDLGRFQV
uniref:Endonuclease/exonuclease/phosphatase domain-containing protein n=1 Tax=Phlebotomus papatasi TaxID=29031 RepID=A0A1B0DJ05_PHLPP